MSGMIATAAKVALSLARAQEPSEADKTQVDGCGFLREATIDGISTGSAIAMIKRKQFVIDRKFQFRTTFSIIGIVCVMMSIVISALGVTIAINNHNLVAMMDGHRSIVSTQYESFSALIVVERSKRWHDLQAAMEKAHRDIDANMGRVWNDIAAMRAIVTRNNILIITSAVIFVLQGLVLYYILIHRTHRISGPLYLISQYLDDINNGKTPDIRPLRENDEFHGLYEKFGAIVASLKTNGCIKD